ncbi:MAG: ROK family protein [Candidatus Sulfotelmatobacter sp.]
MPEYILAADVGGTKIAAAAVSRSGRITHRCEVKTAKDGGRAVVDQLIALLHRLPQRNVRAIGVDVPGLAYQDGSVWAPNIRGWKRMPLGRLLRKHFGVPVTIESDRNAFVVGEAWRGAARGCRNAIFLVVGTGIGAGILADGRLVRGQGELAGSVGWMAIRDEFLAPYASIGCLESLAAGPGIGIAASRRLRRTVTCQEVAQLARRGDETARAVLREAGCSLGLALANLVSIFNPAVILIGGGVAEAGSFMLRPAVQVMKKWTQPIALRQVRILPSRLGDSAGLLGAAKLALDGAKKQRKLS